MLYVKTEAGRGEVQGRTLPLTPSQRQVLILCDGERQLDDLLEMIPEASLRAALEQLLAQGLLEGRAVPARAVKPPPVELTEAERFRAIVELATSLAVDLGFTARIKAQLQIERANTVSDLTQTVDLLCQHLTEQHKDTPLMALRLNKLRQLATA